jgi:hypothetical protein
MSSDWPSLLAGTPGGLLRSGSAEDGSDRVGFSDGGLGFGLGFDFVMLSKCDRSDETGFFEDVSMLACSDRAWKGDSRLTSRLCCLHLKSPSCRELRALSRPYDLRGDDRWLRQM